MKIFDAILPFLAALCRAGADACIASAEQAARKIFLMAGLIGVAMALLLGALGLMIAALFIGLSPCLGAHWAAMIAAGASLAGSSIFLAIACKVFRGR